MNIAKAIEILDPLTQPTALSGRPDVKDAVQLGIEALNVYQKGKINNWYPSGFKLPSETIDD